MNTKFSEVANLYQGCEVEVTKINSPIYGLDYEVGEMCVLDLALLQRIEMGVIEVTPRLYSLADITEEHAIECELYDTNQASSCGGFDGFKESLLHSRWTSYTPTQFTQLLKWGYWLFGDESFETGEIIKKQK